MYVVQLQTTGEQSVGLGCAYPSGLLATPAPAAAATAGASGGSAASGGPAVGVHPNTGQPMVSLQLSVSKCTAALMHAIGSVQGIAHAHRKKQCTHCTHINTEQAGALAV